MRTPGMSVEPILVRDLLAVAVAAEDRPEEFPVVPISRERAAAQACNPVAVADDVGLLLLRKEGRCIGYLGLLPQQVAAAGALRNVYALTTIFIERKHRGSGGAMMAAATGLGRDLLGVGGNKLAQRFLLKNGCRALSRYSAMRLTLPGATWVGKVAARGKYVLRALAHPRSLHHTDKAEVLLRAATNPIRRRIAMAWSHRVAPAPRRHQLRRVPILAPTVEVEREAGTTHVYWDAATLNWMVTHPWFVEGRPKVGGPPERYHFGVYKSLFQYVTEEIFAVTSGRLVGFVVFLAHMRRGQPTLSVLQYRVPSADDRRLLLARALEVGADFGVDVIIAGHEFLAFAQEGGLAAYNAVEERTTFIWPAADSVLAGPAHPYQERHTDGDIAFF